MFPTINIKFPGLTVLPGRGSPARKQDLLQLGKRRYLGTIFPNAAALENHILIHIWAPSKQTGGFTEKASGHLPSIYIQRIINKHRLTGAMDPEPAQQACILVGKDTGRMRFTAFQENKL